MSGDAETLARVMHGSWAESTDNDRGDPMTELTDTERNRLTPWAVDADDLDDIAVAVEAILTARLARIEALADGLHDDSDPALNPHAGADRRETYRWVERRLRAALAASTPDEVQP